MENRLNDESILFTVKKILGISYDYEVFDYDLVSHINSALFTLNQMGIGRQGFYITDVNETWKDFLQGTQCDLHAVKSWVAMKVKIMFDPPATGVLIDSYNNILKELEWRMYITENYIGEI